MQMECRGPAAAYSERWKHYFFGMGIALISEASGETRVQKQMET